MGVKIIDLGLYENEDRTVSFDTVLFEDTEKNRWMLATVDSIDFQEPAGRLCQAFEVDSLRQGKLRTEQYDAEIFAELRAALDKEGKAMKRHLRAETRQQG